MMVCGTFWRVCTKWGRSIATSIVAVWALAGTFPTAWAQQAPPIKVVATFSILADMVAEVGGKYVDVSALVDRHVGAHHFEITPQAVHQLATAELVVENGLGYEPWLSNLKQMAQFRGARVVASRGVLPRLLSQRKDLESGDKRNKTENLDPYAWHDLSNGMIYVENIAQELAKVDPDHADDYQRRAERYLEKLKKLDEEIKLALSAIPEAQRRAIVPYDAFSYFGEAYGVRFTALSSLSDDALLSAKGFPEIVELARQSPGIAMFTHSTSDPALMEQLAQKAAVPLGGPLYADALADRDEPAGSYLGMFHWNAGQLISVLK